MWRELPRLMQRATRTSFRLNSSQNRRDVGSDWLTLLRSGLSIERVVCKGFSRQGKAFVTVTAKTTAGTSKVPLTGQSQWALVWREFRKRRLAVLAAVVIVLL